MTGRSHVTDGAILRLSYRAALFVLFVLRAHKKREASVWLTTSDVQWKRNIMDTNRMCKIPTNAFTGA